MSTVLFIGGLGRSGSTLLDRMLGRLDDVWSVGELVHLWERGLKENNRCGCGQRFADCPFWRRVGQVAFGGWDRLDVEEVLALKASVDRNRFVPLMVLPGLAPAYRARLRRYLDLLERLYGAVREVSGRQLVVDASKHASHAFLVRRLRGVDLRLVHLVRDSRGVAFSWTKRMRRAEVVSGDALMATDTPLRMSARYLGYNLLFHLLHPAPGSAASCCATSRWCATRRTSSPACSRWPAGRRPPASSASSATAGSSSAPATPWPATRCGSAAAGSRSPSTRSGGASCGPGTALLTSVSTWPLLLAYGYLRGGGRGR